MLWEVGQKEEKKDDDPQEKAPAEVKAAEEQNVRNHEKAIKAAHAAKTAEQAAQTHQFNLDEEDDGGNGLASKKRANSRVRKGISLIEYQERKAAGTL